MAQLDEIDAIKRLKYKYFRTLDTKKWDEMAECFAEDAKTSYSGGKYSFEGRDTIMSFLKKGLGPHMISMHQGHHPEIELTSDTTATGIWALQDYVIDLKRNTSLFGAAFYQDEYVKVNGEWKIKFTGYERTFEEVYDRGDIKSLKLTQQMFRLSDQ